MGIDNDFNEVSLSVFFVLKFVIFIFKATKGFTLNKTISKTSAYFTDSRT